MEDTEQISDARKEFLEVGEKLKAAKETKEIVAKKEAALARNSLSQLAEDKDLASLYAQNAQVGAENLAGESPLLKVHAVGRSKSELADGTEPNDGWFYYKPTGEQFESITCHILTISRGFRAEGLDEGKKDVFNQIMGGVIITEGDMKPFLMYMTGLKLSRMWEFGKEASKYTHMKPVSIPMFALTVRLTTEKLTNSFGKSWVINFEIVKADDGAPALVLDQGEFNYLKDHVATLQEAIDRIVFTKAKTVATEEVEEVKGETVDPDDIPF